MHARSHVPTLASGTEPSALTDRELGKRGGRGCSLVTHETKMSQANARQRKSNILLGKRRLSARRSVALGGSLCGVAESKQVLLLGISRPAESGARIIFDGMLQVTEESCELTIKTILALVQGGVDVLSQAIVDRVEAPHLLYNHGVDHVLVDLASCVCVLQAEACELLADVHCDLHRRSPEVQHAVRRAEQQPSETSLLALKLDRLKQLEEAP